MPDYQQGKIYSIRSFLTREIYIGSTCNKLSVRMAQHRALFKAGRLTCTSVKILEKGNAYIELIEAFPCNSREELNQKEGEYIRTSLLCVNNNIAGRTREEYNEGSKEETKEREKAYREANKEYIKERAKTYRENHKEQAKEYVKEYNKANKDKINSQARERYAAAKEKIN